MVDDLVFLRNVVNDEYHRVCELFGKLDIRNLAYLYSNPFFRAFIVLCRNLAGGITNTMGDFICPNNVRLTHLD